MTRRKPRSSREDALRPAEGIAGSEDAPLDVLLHMMRDPGLGSRERIEIAKICLPFVHPRIAPLHPSESEPEREPVDICDPAYMHELIRALAFSLTSSARQEREIPAHIWDLMQCIPRAIKEVRTRESNNASAGEA